MEIEIDCTASVCVTCKKCGSSLDVEVDYPLGDTTINVEICDYCVTKKMDEEGEREYERGYEEAKNEYEPAFRAWLRIKGEPW